MTVSDVISQLKSLKEIEPNENWVVSVREEILTKAPYNDTISNFYAEKPSKMDSLAYIYESITKKHRFMPSLATMSIILLVGSFFTVTAAKSSLPGDPLYSIKLANENIVLAVSASEGDKAKIEIEQAGKRLEELTEISKKSSDLGQQEKVEQLVANFEQKVNSAQTRMAKINDSGEKKGVASVAKVINIQSEKYSDVLAKTSSNLPSVIQEKVSDKFARAISNTDKINTQSLLIIIETKDGDESAMSDVEIVEKLKKKLDQIGGDASRANTTDNTPSDNSTIIKDSGTVEGNGSLMSASSTYSTIKDENSAGTGEIAVSDVRAGSVPTNEDAKQTLIKSANESIQNNDIQAAAKSIGKILAIDEKIASDDKTASTHAVPVDATNSDAADDGSATEDADKVDDSNSDTSSGDTKKIDLTPSINIVE
ncbi:MAG: DUF5667 domain-containing protein [Minisyncoccia bacterium]